MHLIKDTKLNFATLWRTIVSVVIRNKLLLLCGIGVYIISVVLAPTANVNAQADNNSNKTLDNTGIIQIIQNKSLIGTQHNKVWKRFHLESGHIHYSDSSGATENGYWRVENDLYCTNWPPSSLWHCFIVHQSDKNKVTFKSVHGSDSFSATVAN